MKNKVFLWIQIFCLIAVVLMILYPPWIQVWNKSMEGVYRNSGRRSIGYGYLWCPPKEASNIDYGRLALQIGAAGIVILLVSLSGKLLRKENEK
jgi:hypothetical protein